MRPAFPKHLILSSLLALALAACHDVTAPVDPEVSAPEPFLAISDGAHAGNAHFYFLPPMVPSPSPTGTFDGSLSPEVQICVWDGTVCGAILAIFNVNAGPGSETVQVSGTNYIVNWHTEEILDNYTLGAGETFRVRVLVQAQELGFADIDVVGSGKELKNVNTNEFIPLLDGRTLPIKFRIEDGALVDGGFGGGEIASAGWHHSCAVTSDGRAYCWGRNTLGQLGRGSIGGIFNTPQLVVGGLTWQSVQASRQHTCGLTTDGQMHCWGSNFFGMLGTGITDFINHPIPELVIGGHTFQSLASLGSAGSLSSCGVTTGGDMYCWGLNSFGELGIGTTTFDEPTPVLVTGGHKFAGSAALARQFTCGLTTAGDILCWGRNDFGQLGRRTVTFGANPTPAVVGGRHTFESVTVGAAHACGINTSGAALCWGANFVGQLGLGITPLTELTPQLVTGGHTFTQLSGGWLFSCGVRTDGAGLCWGLNSLGQLGRGSIGGIHSTPGLVFGGHTFQAIGAGFVHACGVTTSGDTFCWGRNFDGELGNGTFTQSSTPVFAIDLDP